MSELHARVPKTRIRALNASPLNGQGVFVLYWMTAFRRVSYNFALQRAVECSAELGKPLVVLEALRCGYPWASDRLHAFVLQGMGVNGRAFARAGLRYFPYVETSPAEGSGLLEALSQGACCVVADDCPSFFLPRMVESAAGRLRVRMEAVDSNGLLPLGEAPRSFPTAYAFRRFLQKTLTPHLLALPAEDPLAAAPPMPPADIPAHVLKRWREADQGVLSGEASALTSLTIDHTVAPARLRGGEMEGRRLLRKFIEGRLPRYDENRNQPEVEGTSGLSPYLHFGHVSAHEVFKVVAEREGWSIEHVSQRASGSRTGWWGMGPAAEAFLDQLVTWRELGHNAAAHLQGYAGFGSLPDWSLRTLHKHASDLRPHLYSLEALEGARTHDPLWNAAQRQLVREGRLHNYLRMLWGKKILEWSPSPKEALEVMLRLNDTYALDGRDPNSVSGIFWCLGRYDRPWGPERPIFGTVRYMSSENTARKLRVGEYLRRYAE
jgi:deoxyribodipyrimidine photo-lyase